MSEVAQRGWGGERVAFDKETALLMLSSLPL